MIEVKWYINNTQFRPDNADDIGFAMNFTGAEGVTEGEINVDSLILATEARKIVSNHIDSGAGILQGIPVRAEIESVVLDYYISLKDSPRISGEGDGSIEVKIKKRKSFDWFKTNADNLSFEAINRTNTIPTIKTKYVIVRDNQGMITLTSLMAAYSLSLAIAEQTKSLIEAIGELTTAAAPDVVVGVGVGANAGGPILTVVNGGTIKPVPLFWAVAKAILQAAFLLLTILAFINMIKNIVQIIFPRVRELKSATMYQLLSVGCQKLGFTFDSSIITPSSAYTILPIPVIDTKDKSVFLESLLPPIQPGYTKGYPTAIDTIPTLGSLVDAALDMFNGKIFVDGNTVRLERRDNWQLTSSKSITNTLNLQGERRNEWTYNTGEVWKRYYLHYQVDFSDTHTTDNSKGTKCEYSTEPLSVVDEDLVDISGFIDVPIPFSFGTRKDVLSPSENFWKNICVLVDKVSGNFGASSDLTSKAKSRIGVMQISQPQYSVTKLLYQIGSKQPTNFRDYLAADLLYNVYHKINEVDINLKRIYDIETAFSSKDFEALQNNNYIYDTEGNHLEILSFEWVNNSKMAKIEYAQKAIEPTNTKTIKIHGE